MSANPTTAARRQRRRIAHWHAQAVLALLRLGAGPDELRALAAVAASLRMKAVQATESSTATAPPPQP